MNDACNLSVTRCEHSLPLCAALNIPPSSIYNRATSIMRYILIQCVTFVPCTCDLWCLNIMELTPTQTTGTAPLPYKRPWDGSSFYLRPTYVFIVYLCAVLKKIWSAVFILAYRLRCTSELQRHATTYSHSFSQPYCSTYARRMIPQMHTSISVS